MGKYDITLRHLIRSGGREFLRAIGTEGHVTHVQTEFPSTRERRVDSLAVVDSADGRQNLIHLEFQAAPDATMPRRMLEYYCDILAWLDSRRSARVDALPLEIVQTVVYVGTKRWNLKPGISSRNLDFRFEFVVTSKLDTQLLLEAGDLADAIIALLSADGTNPDVIKSILTKIAREPEHERADALAQLLVLSELRDVRPLIEQEYKAMAIVVSVENSTILRPPIDRAYAEGKVEGKAEGMAEGQAKGKAKGKAEDIEIILSQRFAGQVPAGLVDCLVLVDVDTLDEILRRSLTAASVEEALGSHMPANKPLPSR